MLAAGGAIMCIATCCPADPGPCVNGTQTIFVGIPAGSFQMGNSLAASNDGAEDELPVHAVNVSAFWMSQCPVTMAQWQDVMAWAGSNGYIIGPGTGKASDHPAHSICWYDAVKWCNAKSEMEGRTPCYSVAGTVYRSGQNTPDCDWSANGYRLPTEAEWEKAARGGLTGERFPWGDTITHEQANYYSSTLDEYDLSSTRGYNSQGIVGGLPYTTAVGTFAPNDYGLYDMAGNVEEWCWDLYGPYSSSAQTDPHGCDSGIDRVVRGGSWNAYAQSARCADRMSLAPDLEYTNLGFRLVLVPEPAALSVLVLGALALTLCRRRARARAR
jgi:formylglycine-generating enzyme required for sulfatase activity